ncbi:hypothetical protein DBR00_02635 [Pseudomonas sp. HMWF032]|uniref:hypothetical protein n=1 Tax=Pseudomonas sp. HMWF032 TaxID=2056866 RepID=UPI000D385CE2|nr:hypothetical protein [Pseudomonas sp. HMWF032]PTS86470.1 hypothetical protein DBR00_02635 [Pseudomonas sp. HMWF032]PTT81342.1 hypothetical protein DBR41_16895 [Pseudomonas sp. HMWF010]
MSSGGGSSPTPNRTCTGTLTTSQRLVLVGTQYSLNGANWTTTPPTSVPAGSNAATVFVANGQTPDGKVTYQADDGTQFILQFTMNGTNSANILGVGGTASSYNYNKTFPTAGDTITVAFTLSNS